MTLSPPPLTVPLRTLLARRRSSGASAYDAAVLTDSPVGYWPLNEGSGTTAVDRTGNGNNGTYSGSFALGQAALLSDGASCVNFTGGQMAVPDAAPLRLGASALSIELFVNASSLAAYAALCDNGSSAATRAYSFFINAAGAANSVFVDLGGDPKPGQVTISQSLAVSTLYHLVITANGTTLAMYVNGTSVLSTAAVNGTNNSSTGMTWFGNPSTGAGLFQGKAAKLALYNTTLSPAQVSAHYAAR